MEDLLKFSRPYKRVDSAVDLNTSIREALALIPHFLTDKIAIHFPPSPETPSIKGDPDRLHQLFLNLIMNALDAMKGGGNLTIQVRPLMIGPEAMVEISFRDTGCGIKEEDRRRIFDPFFTTKEMGKGTGLGLSVSYGIVKDHQGDIRVESEIDKGTVFYITFPAWSGHEQ